MKEIAAWITITNDDIKNFMMTPFALFLVMLVGSFGSALNQIVREQRQGSTITFRAYITHWPELSAAMIANVFAWMTLLLADQLNFAAAVGIGFAANSLADQVRLKGRSEDIKSKEKVNP
jgi:hypothetical protein